MITLQSARRKSALSGVGVAWSTRNVLVHTHLLSECVANITTVRDFLEAAIHRTIYYVHVRKWVLTVPRERIFFTTTNKMIRDTHSVLREAHKFI